MAGIIDEIEKKVYSGMNITEICNLPNYNYNTVSLALKELEESDKERYELLQEKLKDNIGLKKQKSVSANVSSTVNYKERFAKIEPLILDGKTLVTISEITGLSVFQIHNTIKALQYNTDIYDEEKYKILTEKIKENSNNVVRSEPKIKESEYEDYLNKIEYYVFQNYLVREINSLLSINDRDFNKIISSLINPNSPNYDENRYNKIKNQIRLNANKRKSEEAKNYAFYQKPKISDAKFEIIKKVANQELDVFEAAKKLNIPLLTFFIYLTEVKEEELIVQLKPILSQYGFGKKLDNSKSLSSYPLETQKEILLMALTYRVSFQNLSDWFGFTIEDVITTFSALDYFQKSLYYLFEETIVENEQNKESALMYAKEYWHQRNILMKALNEAKKENKEATIDYLKMKLNKLRFKINDSLLKELVKKDSRTLTEEEKDLIAWYPLKYYYSLSQCEKLLCKDRKTIINYQENLTERNKIFSEKLDFYRAKYQLIQEQYVEYSTNFSRGGSR